MAASNLRRDERRRLIAEGERAICLTSPTGGGKSTMIEDALTDWVDSNT